MGGGLAEECWRNTGRDPTTTKWVDANKGRNGEIQIGSRLVARDFRTKQFVFAAMPPLEIKRMFLPMAMVEGDLNSEKGVLKGKKGHLNSEKAI